MRRSRLAAARAGHVRKRGQPCGRQRNVGSPRGPHLMVSTSMVYGCIIDVFNTENISAECSGEKPRHAPGSPAFTALGSAWAEDSVVGNTCPGRCFAALPRKARHFGASGGCGCCGDLSLSLFRALRERRVTLGWVGNVVVAATDPRHKLPSAYLREGLLVLHLQLLFQGGVKFPTGGKSGGAKGVPWRRRGVCDRADESATRACVGSHAG